MTTFSEAERSAARKLIDLALAEDLGERGDLTCALLPTEVAGKALFVSRKGGILSGLPVASMIYERTHSVVFEPLLEDGCHLRPGTALARVRGPMGEILSTERTVLNFLQRLSGVATLTRTYVDAIAGLSCQLLDTRKTTPGWRLLEKYAVRCGGGHNHRMGLYDGVMLKDNHLAALGSGAIGSAVKAVRQRYSTSVPVEVEVDTLEQLDEALSAGPDVVLLDNMEPDKLREAVRRRNQRAAGILLEASGGVSLGTIRAVAETGVDRISVGALTHSAVALDIGLDYEQS